MSHQRGQDMKVRWTIVWLLAAAAFAQDKPKPLIPDYFSAVIGTPPASMNLDPFYAKYTEALGLPLISSAKVPDAALLVARDIVIHMLAKRPDIREGMIKAGFRVGVMAETEMTTDI